MVVDPSGLTSLLGIVIPTAAGGDPGASARLMGGMYETLCDSRVFGVSAVGMQCLARPVLAADPSLEPHGLAGMLPDEVADWTNATLDSETSASISSSEAQASSQRAVDLAQSNGLLPPSASLELLAAGIHDDAIAGAGLRPSRSAAALHALSLLLAPHVPVIRVRGSGSFAEVRAGELSIHGVALLRYPVIDEGAALRARYADVLATRLGAQTGLNTSELSNFTTAVTEGLLPIYVPDETRLLQLLTNVAGGDTYWLDTFVDPVGASNGVYRGGLVAMPEGTGTYVGDVAARSRV